MNEHDYLDPSPGPTPATDFPYTRLLAYRRGEITNPIERAEIERRIQTDPRWKAHDDSLKDLDLEMIAAEQDARDLDRFSPAQATNLCRTMAKTQAAVLLPLVKHEADEVGGADGRAWARHFRSCPYCRRMRRHLFDRLSREEMALPDAQLAREWLLDHLYLERLTFLTVCLSSGVPVAPEKEELPVEEEEELLAAIPFGGAMPLEGPTELVPRKRPAEFAALMAPVIELLMRELFQRAEFAEAFGDFLQRDEITARLRRAVHVRDEFASVLETFFESQGLPDLAERARQRVTRSLMDRIIWRVTAERLKERCRPQVELQALEEASRRLTMATIDPLDAVRGSFHEVIQDRTQRIQLWTEALQQSNAYML